MCAKRVLKKFICLAGRRAKQKEVDLMLLWRDTMSLPTYRTFLQMRARILGSAPIIIGRS